MHWVTRKFLCTKALRNPKHMLFLRLCNSLLVRDTPVFANFHLTCNFFFYQMYSKIEKVPRDIRRAYSGKRTSSGKGLVSTSRTYASPNRTGPGVQRSNRPMSACNTSLKCSMVGWLVVLRINVDLAIFSHISTWKQEITNL